MSQVEVYRIGGKKFVVRTSGGMEIVTRLTPNGAERQTPYRADVVKFLGELVWQPSDRRERSNGRARPIELPDRPLSACR